MSRNRPGTEERGQFRGEIDRLAEEARRETVKNRENSRDLTQPTQKKRISPAIWAGLFLVIVEGGLLIAQFTIPRRGLSEEKSSMHQAILVENSCRGAIFRTHSKVVAFTREHGRPPTELVELIDDYLLDLPLDPETNRPLVYSTDGKGFALTCPKAA